jgi:hypothetical protein
VSTIKLVSQSVTGPPGADGEGAPTSATYVTLSTNATLTGERVLTAGTGITLTDAGAGSTLTIAATASGSDPLDGNAVIAQRIFVR